MAAILVCGEGAVLAIGARSLRIALDDHAGEPGIKALCTLLDRDTFRLSDAELELLFRPLALGAGLPLPMTKQMVNGFEVDFHWPELGLVLRFSHWQVKYDPAHVRRVLADTAAHLRPPARTAGRT
jgi:hypothetical protein